MKTRHHIRIATLITLAAILVGACGGSAGVATAVGSTSTAADTQLPAQGSANTEIPAQDSPPQAESGAAANGVASKTAVMTIDGEQMMFDMFICTTFGTEFFSGTGLPGEGAPADSEFTISYEQPLAGDGEDSEYNNTVSISIGNDSWKAGTLTGLLPGEWGSLDWTRDGELLSGTATLEHAWGPEPSEPRQASFVVNCG